MPEAGVARALVSMGSNIDPELHLQVAIDLLFQVVDVRRASRVFATPAVAERPMAPFLNAALAVETGLEPRALKFEVLRRVEGYLGRRRRRADRNAPRTIDLDLALWGDRVASDEELTLPDPEILTRAHVAVPLADVDGELRHPLDRRCLGEIAAGLARGGGVLPAARPDALVRRLDRLRGLVRRRGGRPEGG